MNSTAKRLLSLTLVLAAAGASAATVRPLINPQPLPPGGGHGTGPSVQLAGGGPPIVVDLIGWRG